MKNILIVLSLLFSINAHAQGIVLGSHPDDRFSAAFWGQNNNPVRIFNAVNDYNGGTNRFIESIMPFSMATDDEVASAIAGISVTNYFTTNFYSGTQSNNVDGLVISGENSLLEFDPTIGNAVIKIHHGSSTHWLIEADSYGNLSFYDEGNLTGGPPTFQITQDNIVHLGSLRVGNTAQAYSGSNATHTIPIRDGNGVLYNVLAVPAAP